MKIIDYTDIKGNNQKALELVAQKAKQAGINIEPELVFGQVNIDADAGDIIALCKLFKEDKGLSFEYIRSITGTDFEDRYEIVYSLYSFANGWSINIKVKLDHEKPAVDSIIGVYKGADWFEREIWEMLGIRFIGHPNLKRLLLADDWPEGKYPLRQK